MTLSSPPRLVFYLQSMISSLFRDMLNWLCKKLLITCTTCRCFRKLFRIRSFLTCVRFLLISLLRLARTGPLSLTNIIRALTQISGWYLILVALCRVLPRKLIFSLSMKKCRLFLSMRIRQMRWYAMATGEATTSPTIPKVSVALCNALFVVIDVVAEMSGYARLCQRSDDFCYAKAPRALLFAEYEE